MYLRYACETEYCEVLNGSTNSIVDGLKGLQGCSCESFHNVASHKICSDFLLLDPLMNTKKLYESA